MSLRRSVTVSALAFLLPLAALAVSTSGHAGTPDAPHVSLTATTATPTSATMRAELAAHRRQQIERLDAYAKAGVFPRNFPAVGQLHMFKDPDGRLCAVANLIHQDGKDAVVDEVARTNNGLVVSPLPGGSATPVDGWILASGLTREEVAQIQAPAPRLEAREPLAAPVAVPPSTPPQGAIAEATMVSDLRQRLAAVEASLIRSTDESLDTAASRLQATKAPGPS